MNISQEFAKRGQNMVIQTIHAVKDAILMLDIISVMYIMKKMMK